MCPDFKKTKDRFDLFYVGLVRDPTPPLSAAPLERVMRSAFQAEIASTCSL